MKMATNFLLYLLLSSSSLVILTSQTGSPPPPNRFVLPVRKDTATNLHVTTLLGMTPQQSITLVIDLNAPLVWESSAVRDRSSTFYVPPCRSRQCARANARICLNNTCGVTVENPVTRQAAVGELTQDVLSIRTIQSSNSLGPIATVPNFLFASGPSVLLQNGLPANVQGVVGLGRAPIALPNQLSSQFRFPPVFAMCLARSPAVTGQLFFGDGTYNLNPTIPISRQLMYTPLMVRRFGEYSVGVRSITVNNRSVPLQSGGPRGMAVISTSVPYTILERSIFQAVAQVFANELIQVSQVQAVSPFQLCYKQTDLPSSALGPSVPIIDLVMQNPRAVWSIYGANSMVEARPGIICLGFVDGGVQPGSPIVIGTQQLEDNLLQFDVGRARLGFSSSLLARGTTCQSTFNFTTANTVIL